MIPLFYIYTAMLKGQGCIARYEKNIEMYTMSRECDIFSHIYVIKSFDGFGKFPWLDPIVTTINIKYTEGFDYLDVSCSHESRPPMPVYHIGEVV